MTRHGHPAHVDGPEARVTMMEPALPKPSLRLMLAGAPGLLLGAICALGCYLAAGSQLGLYFGGIITATLIAPPLVLAETDWRDRGIALAAIILGIAIVWLVPVLSRNVTFTAWFSSTLVLASYSLALASLAAVLHRIGVGAAAASAMAIVAGIAWLSWPFWLCPWLTSGNRADVVEWLMKPHPLLSINGALRETYPACWLRDKHKIAYTLANVLNDIPYELPRGVLRAVLIHLGIGAILTSLALWGTITWPVRRRAC